MTATSHSVTIKTSCVNVHKAGLQSAFSACSLLLWLWLLLLFKMRCRDLSMIITVQSSTGGFGYRSESYTSGFPVPFRGHVYKVPSDDLLSLLRLYSRTTRTSHESVMYFQKVESIFLLTWKNTGGRSVVALLRGWVWEGYEETEDKHFLKTLLHSDRWQIDFCVMWWAGSLA